VDIRSRLRHLEQAAAEQLVTIELEDGNVVRFAPDVWGEVLVHEWERWGKDHDGEEPGPAHPVVEALRKAKDLEALMREHSTMLGHFVGEDAIIRGEMDRPGPPVKWNEEGTVYE
jgi:hypothetical protein